MQVFETREGKLRISPDGTPQVWLRCSELKDVVSCAYQPVANAERIRAGGIPTCSGDPRCPNKRPK